VWARIGQPGNKIKKFKPSFLCLNETVDSPKVLTPLKYQATQSGAGAAILLYSSETERVVACLLEISDNCPYFKIGSRAKANLTLLEVKRSQIENHLYKTAINPKGDDTTTPFQSPNIIWRLPCLDVMSAGQCRLK
jgi:hypothetical protein